ncbi:MAG TPA: cyclic nucleotide-binding domain-containing protein [Polyangiaceae bacterium]|nr:cyclic nucleotide-binding domain-containing protein [Polyangiaceae bacterium]
MTASARDLRHLPLFRSLTDAQLEELLRVFTSRTVKATTTLFNEGDPATVFQILVAGEVELSEGQEPKLTVRPFAPLGELGALSGLPRASTAVVSRDATLLEAKTEDLMRLFSQSSELAFTFYRSLLAVVGDKVRRDKQRLDEMRGNLIRTQKAMKAIREIVLESDETPISQPICDRLDELIENNRRSHYRVSPQPTHPATARLANGSAPNGARVDVIELSEGFLKLSPSAKLSAGAEATLVLTLPKGEIPVSGKVERAGTDGVLLKLDMLIDEYKHALNGYMTELQMLDFVV